jgi:hypothetical protein
MAVSVFFAINWFRRSITLICTEGSIISLIKSAALRSVHASFCALKDVVRIQIEAGLGSTTASNGRIDCNAEFWVWALGIISTCKASLRGNWHGTVVATWGLGDCTVITWWRVSTGIVV